MDHATSDLAAPDLMPASPPSYAEAEAHAAPYRGTKPTKTAWVGGWGRRGACIAAPLAARGFEFVGVDIDKEKVTKITQGLVPLDEPLLAETIRAGHRRLRATL